MCEAPDGRREVEPASIQVELELEGRTKLRGWKYEANMPACNTPTIPPAYSNPIEVAFKFSTLDFKGSPELTIDKRQNGIGWVFKVTILE